MSYPQNGETLKSDSPTPQKTNSHIQRWITVLITAPALLLLIGYGSPLIFACFIAVVSLVAVYEYGAIAIGENGAMEKGILLVTAPTIVMAFYFDNFPLIIALLVLAMIVAFSFNITHISAEKFDTSRPMIVIFGIVYIPLAFAHSVGLRAEGAVWVYFVIIFAMLGDTFAFYVGKNWGHKKLSPLISPNKSVEGLVAIPFGALLGGGVFAYFFLPEIPFYHIVIITVLGSLLGQIGDLCESMLKRAKGVKDSGSILPGHGGFLDRLDCLLFVFPFVYYYKVFVIG